MGLRLMVIDNLNEHRRRLCCFMAVGAIVFYSTAVSAKVMITANLETVNSNAAASAAQTAPAEITEWKKLECGRASYYADRIAGHPTASGEPYDLNALTAAHRTMDFGTAVRVVRSDTGAAVIVTINDRGPYADNRIIDLSHAAADKINLVTVGVTDVCLYTK